MNKFEFYTKQVGYEKYKSPPVTKYKWLAYKDGKVIECDSSQEAQKISTLYERIVTNKDEIDAFVKEQVGLCDNASELWYNDLRKEYNFLVDAIFDLCYDQAYERCHGSAWDEVASNMQDIVKFLLELQNVMLKNKLTYIDSRVYENNIYFGN